MKEPLRWLDDNNTPSRLREVLAAAPTAPVMPAGLRVKLSTYAAGLATNGVLTKAALGHSLTDSMLAHLASSATCKALAVVSLMGAAGTASYVGMGYRMQKTSLSQAAGARGTIDPRGVVTTAPPNAVTARPLASAAHSNLEPSPLAAPSAPRAVSWGRVSDPILASESVTGRQEPPVEVLHSSLADEARLLEAARSALEQDPTHALELVHQHQRLHTGGQLSAERELIAVDALVRLGRREQAEQRAASQLKQDPDSLYARRLRQLLGKTGH